MLPWRPFARNLEESWEGSAAVPTPLTPTGSLRGGGGFHFGYLSVWCAYIDFEAG